MEHKKILIAESSVEFSESLCKMMAGKYILRMCHSGLMVQQLLAEFCPDVLVMDLALPGLDGISLLKQISNLPMRPQILLTTCFLSPYVEAAIAGRGVDMVVLKPCKVELLVERIQDLMDEEEPRLMTRLQPRITVSSMLIELNLPPKRRGFVYLERAIKLYLEHPAQALTKNIYPEVARAHFSNADAVERAIRQLIHESWEKRDDRVWRLYFSVGREGIIPRPTNAEFISRLAERYRQVRAEQA